MTNKRPSWSFLESSVERSFVWSLALTLLPVVSALIVSWIVARFAGPSVWGTVSWTMAFATAVLIVGKLGLGLGASRLASELGVARPGALRGLLATAVGLRLISTLTVAALALLFARPIAAWFHDPALLWPVRLSAGVVVCASIYEFQEHFLIGLNRHAVVSKVRGVHLSSRVILSAAIVVAGMGAGAVLGGYMLAWVVGITIFGVLLYRHLPEREGEQPGTNLRARLLSISVPLAVSSASVTIYSQMDKLMLGYFDSVEEVGQYAIARAVIEVALFPAFAFVATLRPALASRYARGALDECAALITHSLRLSLVAGVLFASILAVLAVPLITAVYTQEFRYAGELMAIFVVVLVLRSVGALVLPALVAAERTRFYAWLTTASAAINFGLNLILIPTYHARGAVIATIISYSFLLILGLVQVIRVFRVRVSAKAFGGIVRTFLAGVLSATVVVVILKPLGEVSGGLAVALAALQALIYIALVVALGVLRRSDVLAVGRNLLAKWK